MATEGAAAISAPALINCHDASQMPANACSPAVTGRAESDCTSTSAQK